MTTSRGWTLDAAAFGLFLTVVVLTILYMLDYAGVISVLPASFR